jgi:hypothetical protein
LDFEEREIVCGAESCVKQTSGGGAAEREAGVGCGRLWGRGRWESECGAGRALVRSKARGEVRRGACTKKNAR